LPGCGVKIAELYQHWRESGSLAEAEEGSKNERLAVLKLFYDIWGVGDTTARDFYNKGWRDLDDLVEFNWGHLSRVQQIGVKFYDDFKLKIPRSEVEEIGSIILSHAQGIDPDFQMVIVGGYRRGKAHSGDVDVVLSHPKETMTLRFIERIVRALEKSEHITHTLTLSARNSERGQAPLPWKGEGRHGSGFDTLDKALVVWKDPKHSSSPHRRVDIIITPWKTAGCAVLGWSGGTTFQRDLRRYCKVEKRLKFDSSGVRSRIDGTWVDLETDPKLGPAPDMITAEKRVFQALGLPYRHPEERCTG
jgi:DNA polymerase IV